MLWMVIYHKTQRGLAQIEFIPSIHPKPPTEPTTSAFLHMPNISIPATKTNYICYTVPIPLPDPNKQYHVIQIDPYVDPENVDIVHHILVHTCTLDVPATDYLTPKNCNSPLGSGACYGILYVWAVGGNSLILPPLAGFRIGANSTNATDYLIIELHYSNPERHSGRYDSSGFYRAISSK